MGENKQSGGQRQEATSSWWRRPIWMGISAATTLAFALGAVFALTAIVSVELTSKEGFCISCHEMQAFVYEEYKQSNHFYNRTGVRAQCKDCHVPHPWGAKIWRKMQATVKEVPGHFLGRIDTREEFEAHRYKMAESVWHSMRETDSRECRSCHEAEQMNPDLQDRRAARKHAQAAADGKTCIDCHKGVAHVLPEMPDDD